jgi:hypothetical protein
MPAQEFLEDRHRPMPPNLTARILLENHFPERLESKFAQLKFFAGIL